MVHESKSDVPVDTTIIVEQLTRVPYSIYRRLRAETPVVRVPSINRIILTKAADTSRRYQTRQRRLAVV